MLGLFLSIAAFAAIGAIVAYAVILSFRWLKNKIREKFREKNVKKVAVADLQKMIDECENTVSMEELDELSEQGYTHVMATVDNAGKVSGLDVIKDENESLDEQVDRMLGREKMVVVTA